MFILPLPICYKFLFSVMTFTLLLAVYLSIFVVTL
jgi:hypothetical protein